MLHISDRRAQPEVRRRATAPLLDENANRTTFEKMLRVQADGDAPNPFWAYVHQIPIDDFRGYDCSEGSRVLSDQLREYSLALQQQGIVNADGFLLLLRTLA